VETEQALDFHARVISRRRQIALVVAGLASWGGGAFAAVENKSGTGAAALILVGAICLVIGLMGRWPSKISMSGNEISWEAVKVTVDSQIRNARASGETETVLAELTNLRQRLDVLQRTGSIPKHPAQIYDEAVETAIQRIIPGVEIIRDERHSRATADFIVRYDSSQIWLETKWSQVDKIFAGSTLPELLRNIPGDAKLLIVINTTMKPAESAYALIRNTVGDRGRIVAWRSIRDDPVLGDALISLMTPPGPIH
jgi:hypothetical protein